MLKLANISTCVQKIWNVLHIFIGGVKVRKFKFPTLALVLLVSELN